MSIYLESVAIDSRRIGSLPLRFALVDEIARVDGAVARIGEVLDRL